MLGFPAVSETLGLGGEGLGVLPRLFRRESQTLKGAHVPRPQIPGWLGSLVLGMKASKLGALTRKALILRPPVRLESPPLYAQGHRVVSPPREPQATPRRATRPPSLRRNGIGWSRENPAARLGFIQ